MKALQHIINSFEVTSPFGIVVAVLDEIVAVEK
jgi:hypothetical protein